MENFKDPLTALYSRLNKLDMKDPNFDVIVHAIQEIQYLRSLTESYQRAFKQNMKINDLSTDPE